MLNRRRMLVGTATLMGTAGLFLAGAPPARASDAIRLSGRAFGTSWQITLAGGGGDPTAVGGRTATLLRELDLILSPFRSESAISRFNRARTTDAQYGPAPLIEVASQALRVSTLTAGAFDPTVGPAVRRFGFGPIEGARGSAGPIALAVDGETLTKTDPALTLDLCGIAKGYALDRMLGLARSMGITNLLIEFGGEVIADGRGPDGAPWRIGIADPLLGGVHGVVEARGLAVATSGDAINAYEVAGRRYSHVIDPATWEPVVNPVASVTVLASSAMLADALATALMVMGPERGLAFAEARDLAVLFLVRIEGGLSEMASPAFRRHRIA